MKFATERGYSVFNVYIDKAKTGRNDHRPEFQAMMNKRVLEKSGVKMMSVTQPNLYRDSPEDIITESVIIGFDKYYSRILSMHTKKGMREHIKKGFWRGGIPPYGYRLDKILKTLPAQDQN